MARFKPIAVHDEDFKRRWKFPIDEEAEEWNRRWVEDFPEMTVEERIAFIKEYEAWEDA